MTMMPMKTVLSFLFCCCLCCFCCCVPSVLAFSVQSPLNLHYSTTTTTTTTTILHASTVTNDNTATTSTTNNANIERRVLGSQELLMLPRQYGPNNNNNNFPQMNHVSCTVLSATPSIGALRLAIEEAVRAHPLLRSRVDGDGEPDERIDLFQMVRKGEPNPCTFVAADADAAADIFNSESILNIVNVPGSDRAALDESWKTNFNYDLDHGDWCDPSRGPMWKVTLHQLVPEDSNNNENQSRPLPSALLFSFNHAISDQSSANMLADQIIANIVQIEEEEEEENTNLGKIHTPAVPQKMPIALEDSVLGLEQRFSNVQAAGFSTQTAAYVAGKAAEGLKSPVIVPDSDSTSDSGGGGLLGALTIITGNAAGGEDSVERSSTLQFRKLTQQTTTALLEKCRQNGVTVTNALTAAVTLASTDCIDNGVEKDRTQQRNYKVLQSLDMRRFGDKLDRGETVACMAGSMDLMHGPLEDRSGQSLRSNPIQSKIKQYWDLAKEGNEQTASFIENDEGPRQAVRVFDFAMTISDMNNLVDLTAKSKDSQGRAYSAGVSNVGVYDRQKAVLREGETERGSLKTKHGKYEIEDLYFATSHARTGCLYQASCMTVGGEMMCTFHPASPVVSEETNARFADSFIEILEIIAGTKKVEVKEEGEGFSIPENALTLAVAAIGSVAVASHAGGFSNFFQSIMQMKANVADPADFWAALNFWIFFAVGHPILQPILWISDVLHGSPGPKIADLVPATFLAGNIVAIAAFTMSKEIKSAVNTAALFAFFAYVGSGLDGQAGLGDFNLAVDDPYKGQIVKGCPAYEEVRQPSMDGFDLNKYQGFWYEQKFHDWTQFKEVYDTTLAIKLTPDGLGWIDDFAVKGPAPDSAKLSWDKSPVANGAHYFLFGRVDPQDPPGILREKGFGVEFPNYIVDVKKDPTTGEYTEAIQFQCLERGGVRVFEGINFMSKNPTMTDEEMTAMHARAEKAGMYPYGASPEQMHTVARRPVGAPDVDNSWQAMWRAIGVDKLLELLTESIEDGGR